MIHLFSLFSSDIFYYIFSIISFLYSLREHIYFSLVPRSIVTIHKRERVAFLFARQKGELGTASSPQFAARVETCRTPCLIFCLSLFLYSSLFFLFLFYFPLTFTILPTFIPHFPKRSEAKTSVYFVLPFNIVYPTLFPYLYLSIALLLSFSHASLLGNIRNNMREKKM